MNAKSAFQVICLNVSFYLGFLVFSVVGIPVLTLFVALSSLVMSHRATMKRFRRAISWYGLVVIKVLPLPFVRVRYRDLDPRDIPGPCIFVCNHRSSSDPFLIALLPCELVQIVNIWPFRLPVLGKYARQAGYLSVKEVPFEEFSRRTRELLARGVSLVAFPEGTRSGGKEMGQFHGSMFRVALESGVPIVPVVITGNEEIPARGSLLLKPGTVKVTRLPALVWEEYGDMKPFKLKNVVRSRIAQGITDHEG